MYAKAALTHLRVKKEHDAYSNPNPKLADADNCMEIFGLHFSCCWISLLCSQLFFQPSFWKLEFAEDISLQCFLFHYLLTNFICNDLEESLEKTQVSSSIRIFGIDSHLCVFLFLRQSDEWETRFI